MRDTVAKDQGSEASDEMRCARALACPTPNPRSLPSGPWPLPHLAFTLTEILVAIAIIAVLVGLTSVAVVRALDTAKQTRIKTEVDALHAAFEAYKNKYGSYPPCDLRINPRVNDPEDPLYNVPPRFPNAALRRHVAQAFPKYRATDLGGDLVGAGVDVYNFRPDQAVVFWLAGFNPDSAHPFEDLANLRKQKKTTPPLFDFDPTRLKEVGAPMPPDKVYRLSSLAYFAPGTKFDEDGRPTIAPYVYFDSQSYGAAADVALGTAATPNSFNTSLVNGIPNAPPATAFNVTPAYPTGWNTPPQFPDAGAAVPYWRDDNGNGTTYQPADLGEGWVNADSFQIIAPGLDGKYGADAITARLYKTGTGYSLADDDNVTNFCPRPRLGDDKP
jgi:prepilin-type N-terminal cleavage/methylation domain-containing protein